MRIVVEYFLNSVISPVGDVRPVVMTHVCDFVLTCLVAKLVIFVDYDVKAELVARNVGYGVYAMRFKPCRI